MKEERSISSPDRSPSAIPTNELQSELHRVTSSYKSILAFALDEDSSMKSLH